MQQKLTSGNWRPRLLDFVWSLDAAVVKSTFEKAFQSLPYVSKVVVKLTILKGVGSFAHPLLLKVIRDVVMPFIVVAVTINHCSRQLSIFPHRGYLSFLSLIRVFASLASCRCLWWTTMEPKTTRRKAIWSASGRWRMSRRTWCF